MTTLMIDQVFTRGPIRTVATAASVRWMVTTLTIALSLLALSHSANHVPRIWDLQNQFGDIRVQSKKVTAILVPANTDTEESAAPPGDATHYVCYQVKDVKGAYTDQTPGACGGSAPVNAGGACRDDADCGGNASELSLCRSPRFRRDLQAFFVDQFDDCASDAAFAGTQAEGRCLFDLKQVKELCNPMNKSAVEPPRETDAILSVQNNVEASSRADWVLAYARQLERNGDIDQAVRYYRAGLRLDPTDADARARLAALEGGAQPAVADPRIDPNDPLTPEELARIPLWTEEDSVVPLERRPVSPDLARLRRVTAVVVRVGDVPDWLLDALGMVIERELGIPAIVASQTVKLPPHSRVRGLVFGRQWEQYSLVRSFYYQLLSNERYRTPARWILVTAVDIYSNHSNFVFSQTYPWGAVVSYARLGDLADRTKLIQRMAKNTLGAFVKSFGVPISTDRNCVTSYTSNLAEFDSKGNRPTAQSLHLLLEAVIAENRALARRQATGP